jgi:hypothetical protein
MSIFQPDESQEINIRLAHYDDIFSIFDMRPYAERALSVDFLDEIKRAVDSRDSENIELVLYLPQHKRDEAHEKNIHQRLVSHINRHYKLLSAKKRGVLGTGVSMVILGVACMIAATLVVFEDPSHDVLLSFLVVFLEPAAWFLLWEGMDQIIFNSKNINPELNFYRVMHKSEKKIRFETVKTPE